MYLAPSDRGGRVVVRAIRDYSEEPTHDCQTSLRLIDEKLSVGGCSWTSLNRDINIHEPVQKSSNSLIKVSS